MAKVLRSFIVILLLLTFILSITASRPGPTAQVLEKYNHRYISHADIINDDENNCEGAEGEECLIRRTLAAHVDYIYTQKHQP